MAQIIKIKSKRRVGAKMIEEVYKEIRDIMFKDVVDLYNRREEIHRKYVKKELVVKQVYKWYYFSELGLVNYELKSLMWNYINNDEINLEDRLNLNIEFKKFIKRQSKLKREEWEERQEEKEKEQINR